MNKQKDKKSNSKKNLSYGIDRQKMITLSRNLLLLRIAALIAGKKNY
jgi:hypothetical protein